MNEIKRYALGFFLSGLGVAYIAEQIAIILTHSGLIGFVVGLALALSVWFIWRHWETV